MNARPLVLIGGGGHCRSVIDAAESTGLLIRGILERAGARSGSCLGYPVLGDDSLMALLAADCDFVVTVGSVASAELRRKLHMLVKEAGGRLATVVASTAHVSRHASVGAGTVVLHNAHIGPGATIGCGCIVNSGAVAEHDASVGDCTHISTRAVLNGGVSVGSACLIGSGAVLAQGVTIPDNTIIGAGAVVLHSITESGTYAGVPTRRIK